MRNIQADTNGTGQDLTGEPKITGAEIDSEGLSEESGTPGNPGDERLSANLHEPEQDTFPRATWSNYAQSPPMLA